jgi:hypothetical protein
MQSEFEDREDFLSEWWYSWGIATASVVMLIAIGAAMILGLKLIHLALIATGMLLLECGRWVVRVRSGSDFNS